MLVLHGFTSNPQSMRPQADALAAVGFTVDLPLLPGHGTAVEDLVPLRWPDWAKAVEEAYEALAARCRAVLVAGLSMGGTLATWLAARHPEIAGLAVVNPMIELPAEELHQAIRDLLASGVDVADGIGSDIAKGGVVESAYTGTPLAAALSLFDGVRELQGTLGQIRCPVLLFSSRTDHVVPPESGDRLERSVAGPIERVYLERSFHVATVDWDGPVISERLVAFANHVLGGTGADGAATDRAPSDGAPEDGARRDRA